MTVVVNDGGVVRWQIVRGPMRGDGDDSGRSVCSKSWHRWVCAETVFGAAATAAVVTADCASRQHISGGSITTLTYESAVSIARVVLGGVGKLTAEPTHDLMLNGESFGNV